MTRQDSFFWNLKITNKVYNNIKIKKLNKKIPLVESFANEWTEVKIPDLTKNVPQTANKNEKIPK